MRTDTHAAFISSTDDLSSELVPPPTDDPGVCPRCRTWNDSDEPAAVECTNCSEVRELLGVAAVPLDVITLYRKPSAMREWLTGYKGRPERNEPFNADYVAHIRQLLRRYFHEHWQTLATSSGGIDAVTVVPSTDRLPPHPLDTILRSLNLPVPVLLALQRGTGELDFRCPSIDAYTPVRMSEPKRMLIVDDVYTTGARINSAAYALNAAGHTVAAALVVARRVNTDYNEKSRAFWETRQSTPFDWANPNILTRSTRRNLE